MEFFRIKRVIPFMKHALVFNVISLVTFALAVFFLFDRFRLLQSTAWAPRLGPRRWARAFALAYPGACRQILTCHDNRCVGW